MKDVTLVLTSCGRPDLLERTLESFYRYNTYPIQEAIIVEDGPEHRPKFPIPNLKYLVNGVREGQVVSIDKAYAEVGTPYIFHCEDDWEFFKPGFIEASLDVLDRYTNILQVWLRAHLDTNQHPIVTCEGFDVPILDPDYAWRGFSWNPGLRRLIDYQRIGGYGRYWQGTNAQTEWMIGDVYRGLGYRAAILPDSEGYVRHIGWLRGVK